MNDLKERELLKKAYADWISSTNPKYHLTIIFKPNLTEKATRKLLDKLIIHLNKSLYKKRYLNGKSKLRGFVSRERGKPTKLENRKVVECDHYHIIFSDNDSESRLVDYVPFLKHIEKQIRYINLGPTKHGIIPKQFQEELIPKYKRPIRDYLLQSYYINKCFDNRLENYLMKICNDWSISNEYVFDCMGIINVDKVEFGRSSLKNEYSGYY